MCSPLISIYITTKNRSELLVRAVNSCLNQTYENIEIIIIDDASIDNTQQVIEERFGQNKKIRYYKNKFSKGSNYCRNKAIRFSKGVYITGLDDDDEFLSDRIKSLYSNFNESYSFICSRFIVSKGKKVTIHGKGGIISIEHIKFNNYVGNQIFTLRDRFKKLGGFDESLLACQDYDLWLRFIVRYGNAYQMVSPSIIVYEGFGCNRISLSQNAFIGYFDFYKKYKPIFTTRQRARKLLRIYEIRNKRLKIKNFIRFFKAGIPLHSIKYFLFYGKF